MSFHSSFPVFPPLSPPFIYLNSLLFLFHIFSFQWFCNFDHISLHFLFVQACALMAHSCLLAVMDKMVLSLTSAQRPTQDSPIYPTLHKGLRELFLVCRDSFSPSLFSHSVGVLSFSNLSVFHSFCLYLLFPYLFFFSQPFCSAEVIIGKSDVVKLAKKNGIQCYLTFTQLFFFLLESVRRSKIQKWLRGRGIQKMNGIREDWYFHRYDGENYNHMLFSLPQRSTALCQRTIVSALFNQKFLILIVPGHSWV